MKPTPEQRIEVTLEYFADMLHYLSRSFHTPALAAYDMRRAHECHAGAVVWFSWDEEACRG